MSEDFPDQPSITVVGGPLDGHEVKLSQGTTVMIGSGRLAHLRLDHPEIELAHVKVSWDDMGISMIDNGSRKGTWINGEPVETAGLIDGDVIEFVAPGSKSAPPKIKIKIPKGSVPDPPPPPPGEPALATAGGAAPVARVPRAGGAPRSARARKASRIPFELPFDLPDLRLVGLGVGAFVLVFGGAWLAKRLFFTAPQLVAIEPSQAEPGQVVTLRGKRFSDDPARNLVWFGSRSYPPQSASVESLQVKVPVPSAPGPVTVRVESPSGKTGSVTLVVLASLEARALDPPGALPGDEVTLSGLGFSDQVVVNVQGQPAKVTAAEATAVRFELPALTAERGARLSVIATIGRRSTRPLSLYFGRVPLVVSLEPPRGVAGDIVRIKGVGFAQSAEGDRVSFGGAPALVLAGNDAELAVVAPPSPSAQPETPVPVTVQARGRTSSDGTVFTLQRLVEGAWVPRFLAGAAGNDAPGRAVVGTEFAPVLLLADKDDARSVGERALRVAAALNAAADRARVGQSVAFEVRQQPATGIAVAGEPALLVRVTADDAAAYQSPPGLPPRGGPPSATALARYWAALLTDYVTIGTSAGKPQAVAEQSASAGGVLSQLRAALPWEYGSGVASSRVVSLSPALRKKLAETAFSVP
jgi:hypothetical protein